MFESRKISYNNDFGIVQRDNIGRFFRGLISYIIYDFNLLELDYYY